MDTFNHIFELFVDFELFFEKEPRLIAIGRSRSVRSKTVVDDGMLFTVVKVHPNDEEDGQE